MGDLGSDIGSRLGASLAGEDVPSGPGGTPEIECVAVDDVTVAVALDDVTEAIV